MIDSADHERLAVAAFVPYAVDTAPSQRFRIEQWAPCLAESGISVSFHPFADEALSSLLQRRGRTLRKFLLTLSAFRRRALLTATLPSGRLVFLHRAACLAGPPVVERWLKRRGHRVVYDFDDAIYLLHSAAANRALSWLKQPGKTATICRLSDHLVVGNSYLAAWAKAHNDAVTVVPTSIDTDAYSVRPTKPAGSPVVVGWTGSSTSQTYLEAFAPMVRQLLAGNDVQLRVISSREPAMPGIEYSWRPWSPESEVRELAEFDVGIMPMPDEEWALGKCALKALQYMAMGIATVASPVGANKDVITHGVNGLLASTEADWLECIGSLAASPDLRARLGVAARRTVEERFSMRRSASALASVIRGLKGSDPSR